MGSGRTPSQLLALRSSDDRDGLRYDLSKPRLTQELASAVSYCDPATVEATAARSSGKAADWGSRGHRDRKATPPR
ncbi:unnamed protein product [Caenorhabditis auriculariae]|uniref:Uncharacterized protein n=1 Tax=Caenorhabditis auriculariae TaxID=2777116 RepID=A0A8S1HXN7_9PELO|nr:unnamed protein product [Caenorhabditis auriculariae]